MSINTAHKAPIVTGEASGLKRTASLAQNSLTPGMQSQAGEAAVELFESPER
jgi:hypothetical protein